MKRLVCSCILSVLIVLVAAGCTPEAAPAPPVTRTAEKASPAEGPASKAGWDKTLAAARQEGKVTIYTTAGPSQTAAWQQGFAAAYGINLEFIVGRGAELREKLFRERRAGLFLADLFMMGASGMLSDLKPEGMLDPIKPLLVLPEAVDPKNWYGGSQIFLDKEGTYVIGYFFSPQVQILVNTDMVREGDIKVYSDLLQPRWNGKIVVSDPTTTGTGQEWFQMVSKFKGLEFMRNLAKQEPVLTRDRRQETEWIARGKYAMLMGPTPQNVAEFVTAGAPIKYLNPSDANWGSSGPGTMGLINRPAHPDADVVFINWLLTREGQTISSKSFLVQSARQDVPTDHLDPLMVRQPGVVYGNVSTEDIALERVKVENDAKSVFGLAPR